LRAIINSVIKSVWFLVKFKLKAANYLSAGQGIILKTT